MARTLKMAMALALGAGSLSVSMALAEWNPAYTLWLPFLGHNEALGSKGLTVSGLNVQNLDPAEPAAALPDYYKQGGGASMAINRPPIPPLAVASFYLPMEPVGHGDGIYAGIVHSDRRVAAIARTEWPRGGGAALYDSVTPSMNVVVPLYVQGVAGQRTHVAIQNSDESAPLMADVRLYRSGSSSPAYQETIEVGPGTSLMFVPAELPSPFLGWMRVESNTPVGVVAFVDFENSEKAVYAFEGVPAEQAADRLYAPLFRNAFFGTTGISVVNPGSMPVRATVTYAGSLGSCVGQTFTQGPADIAPGSSAVFYQGNAHVPGTGTSPLPTGCAGSATIASTGGKVLAIVNDASGNPGNPTTSAAYHAVSWTQGARKVALPLFRNQHTAASLTTGIQVMNIDTETAQVDIRFELGGVVVGGRLCPSFCSATLGPGQSYTWYPPSIPSLPRNRFGSAFVDSNRRLAVIVNDASLTGKMDAAIYNGIKADAP